MPYARHRRLLTGAVAVPLVAVLLAACGDNDKDKAKEAAGATCGSELSNTASTPLPSDVPTPSGGKVYSYTSQGKTQVWYVALAGGPSDLADLRDTYDTALKQKGYSIEGTDQEAGSEAESEFKGPHEGTTNVRPLCSGKDVLRLKLTS